MNTDTFNNNTNSFNIQFQRHEDFLFKVIKVIILKIQEELKPQNKKISHQKKYMKLIIPNQE